jgi:hypothetical protein
MSMYTASVPQLTKMLRNVEGWFDKAEEHARSRNYDPNVLLQMRLAPDMFPFVRQVQSACDNAKFIAARLSGKEAPRHPDTEQTLAELRARVQSTVSFLETVTEADFEGAAKRQVRIGYLPPGKGMEGHVYLNQHALPNVYFHLAMAYALLRHAGVPVGKADFLGSVPLIDLG